mmetsp:Transcript_292/g.474  ORF Transcript_292/g.474 Transcript_292/m.474 type:complete len:389 (+) Transcript_292:267-1433(+)
MTNQSISLQEWGPILRTIMTGIYDEESPMKYLLGLENQLVPYIYSYIMPYYGDFTTNIPIHMPASVAASPGATIRVMDNEQLLLEGGSNAMACYSSDRGMSWTFINPPRSKTARVSLVGCAISPTNVNEFYVAVIDFGGPVLYKTQDRGDTWVDIPLPGDPRSNNVIILESFAIDSRRSHSNSGRLWLGTQSSGAWYSDNQGKTWKHALSVKQGVIFGFDLTSKQYPNDEEVWIRTCFPSSMYHSIDGGKSWSTHPVPLGSVGDFALDLHHPTRQYISCKDMQTGTATLYHRDNDSPRCSWEELSLIQGMAILIHPDIPNRIYIGLHRAVQRSDDGGETWTIHDMVEPDDHSPVVMSLAYQSGRIFARTAYGIYQSLDDGLSWQRAVH